MATTEGKKGELWQQFAQQESLTDEQVKQFQQYAALLTEWNERINLTRITGPADIVHYHFQDSLRVADAIDMQQVLCSADVGSGGGFPGIPLKIKYPHLKMILIEVNHKKNRFLQEVVDQLGLKDVVISSLDWRTFIREGQYDIDLFCARASLRPDELVRMFRPSCHYRHATMVYWASMQWETAEADKAYVERELLYRVGDKERRFLILRSRQQGT